MENFIEPGLQVELFYPDPNPEEFGVLIHERKTDTNYRAHLISNGSDEVYFEVGMYQNLPVMQAIRLFLADVSQRIEQLKASQVRETTYSVYRLGGCRVSNYPLSSIDVQ